MSWLAIAAAVLIVLGLAGWAMLWIGDQFDVALEDDSRLFDPVDDE